MVREGGRQPESKTVVFSVLHSESVLTEEPTAQVRCCPSFSIALSPIVCRRSCRDSTRTLVCSRLLCKQKGGSPFWEMRGQTGTNQPCAIISAKSHLSKIAVISFLHCAFSLQLLSLILAPGSEGRTEMLPSPPPPPDFHHQTLSAFVPSAPRRRGRTRMGSTCG